MCFVCIDIDGVILNMLDSIKDYLNEKGITFIPKNVVKYNFSGDIGCSRDYVFEALSNPKVFKQQKPYKGVLDSIIKLQRSHIQTNAYTTVSSNDIYKIRKDFCNQLNLSGDVYIGDKPVLLEADALFDDCLDEHKKWIEAGYTGKLYLIDAPYNQEYYNKDFLYFDKVIRCLDFNDAVSRYLKTLNKM